MRFGRDLGLFRPSTRHRFEVPQDSSLVGRPSTSRGSAASGDGSLSFPDHRDGDEENLWSGQAHPWEIPCVGVGASWSCATCLESRKVGLTPGASVLSISANEKMLSSSKRFQASISIAAVAMGAVASQARNASLRCQAVSTKGRCSPMRVRSLAFRKRCYLRSTSAFPSFLWAQRERTLHHLRNHRNVLDHELRFGQTAVNRRMKRSAPIPAHRFDRIRVTEPFHPRRAVFPFAFCTRVLHSTRLHVTEKGARTMTCAWHTHHVPENAACREADFPSSPPFRSISCVATRSRDGRPTEGLTGCARRATSCFFLTRVSGSSHLSFGNEGRPPGFGWRLLPS